MANAAASQSDRISEPERSERVSGVAIAGESAEARLTRWVDAHFELVWRLACRLGVPEAHADDVVQETFVVVARNLQKIEPGKGLAYICAVASRLAVKAAKRSRHPLHLVQEPKSERDPRPDPEETQMLRERQRLLEQALDALSDDQRSVFVLYELEGFTMAEIAECLTIPAGTVASRLAAARKSVATFVTHHREKGSNP